MLTKKQHELLTFIHTSLQESPVSPSFDEMRAALGLRSKSSVHRLIKSLQERGFLRYKPKCARSLEILKYPGDPQKSSEGIGVDPGVAIGRNSPLRVIKGSLGTEDSEDGASPHGEYIHRATAVPILGKLSEETLISEIQSTQYTFPFPADMLGIGQHFVLVMDGDFMDLAGILDRDLILFQKTDHVGQGDIALIFAGERAILAKIYQRREGAITLVSSPRIHKQMPNPDDGKIHIEGKVTGLIRRY